MELLIRFGKTTASFNAKLLALNMAQNVHKWCYMITVE